MPLTWALLLLLGLSARRDWGCLQCDHSVQEALKQLRLALIPSRFQQGQLQARAQVVLRGMEGPFFRDYALNAFVGRVGACRDGERALDLGERDQWAGPRLGGEATPPRGAGPVPKGDGVIIPWLSQGPRGISSPLLPRDRPSGPSGVLCQESNKRLNG